MLNKTHNNVVSQNLSTMLTMHEPSIIIQSGSTSSNPNSRPRSTNKLVTQKNNATIAGNVSGTNITGGASGTTTPWTPERASTIVVKSSSAMGKKNNIFSGLS